MLTSGYRSRYQPSYDSGESRRSPRDQSPGRYNDSRDEYRGGSGRGAERRRSISDSRGNHNAFAPNRDTFREPISRESSRDFSTREPPRGPKGLIDAPTGPRASNYQPEFRSDFSFRGDFRGDRGRGRGRGWRDDSRDRGREGDRDYRDRRDDRGPAPFRDDRGGRERWPRETTFRGGRRPSSPQGRGRSPNYGPRDTRDAPPALDIDRTRRGSREPPLSGGSPASDSMPYRGGYGRGRGRGRGRGGFYDDHRPSGRSRSPEASWNRRTQPSATPPPQVPAFGSTSSSVAVTAKPPTSPAAMLTGSISGLVPGVAVPTAPRSLVASAQNPRSRHHNGSATWINPQLKGPNQSLDSGRSDNVGGTLQNGGHNSPRRSTYDMDANVSPQSRQRPSPEPQHSEAPGAVTKLDTGLPSSRSAPRRKPVIGRRPPKAPLSELPEIEDESSSDSGDDLGDDYFANEIAKIKNQIAELSDVNPLAIPAETPLVFLGPIIDSNIEDLATATESAILSMCAAPELPHQPVRESPVVSPTMTSKSILETSSGPLKTPTPVPEPTEEKDAISTEPVANGHTAPPPVPEEEGQNAPKVAALDDTLDADFEVDDIVEPAGPPIVECKPTVNGNSRSVVPLMNEMEEMEYTDDESKAENIEALEVVRKYMATPPISDLPNFNTKPWHQDDNFLRTLAPRPEVEACIRRNLEETAIRRHKEQEEERHRWKDRYLEYRQWTDFSSEDAPVRSRDRFEKSRAEAAAAAAAPNSSSVPSAGAKAEGGRRMGRFATEHDFERVLRESEQEAKEKKDGEERAARAKTASAKEASIPDMAWDSEEWDARKFIDRTHLIPFERSFARLEMSEPIDNFTEEENQAFETAYLEFPKQWGKIADALSGRDYKACIQHYYLVKHSSNIKEKLKKQPKRRKGRRKAAGNPKSNPTDLGLTIRDEGDDAADAENGERRRPRRAAAPTWSFETPASESEVASPAPTPGRKSTTTQKPEAGADAPPTKTRKTKVPREKAVKQPKNSQLLAAAPATMSRRAESPATPAPAPDWKIRRESAGPGASPGVGPGPGVAAAVGPSPGSTRFPPQYDGTGQIPAQFPSPFAIPVDRPSPLMNVNFELMGQPYPTQERVGSAPPMGFDPQQDRRNVQQTSSYWSVPEQSDFPALLKHFGTDWHGIAKHMTSKTHIMVYTTVFQQWLAVPSDSNKSRRVANIQTQVKNFYQRQVDTMGKREWEEYAREADEKRARGEPVGPLPNPTIIPKRRYDLTPSANGRPGSAMESSEDLTPLGTTSVPSQVSSPQPPPLISSRFPALAQAGPVPQIQPATPISVLNKHLPPQQLQQQVQQGPPEPSTQQSGHPQTQPPMQQSMQHTAQQAAHQPIQQAIRQAPTPTQQAQPIQPIRAPRGPGPALGYFSTDASSRPGQAETLSQRSLMAAQEAQLERQAALRVEREQALQREQAAMQREQQIAIQREQQQAMQREINQREANQREANQREANQREANLREANLREANQRETGQRETQIQREAALREMSIQREAALREQAMHREQARQQEAVLREQALQREQSQALALQQRERAEREQQQQQALQSQRQFHLKQETEMPNLRQYEAYNSPSIRNGSSIQSRPEIAKSVMPPAPEPRRPVQQPYQPRNPVRNLLSDNGQGARDTPSPALPRPPMSAPPTSHEQYPPPPSQSAPIAAARPEVRKTVSVMSLLNDEPSEPRPTPTKRVSDVSSSSLQPSRTPPPPQHSLQASRYSTHPPPQSQGSQHMQQHIPPPQPSQQQAPQSQHSYAQPTPQSMHQHSSSIGHSRSYTPNSFESRNYPSSQAQQQQQLYSQAPRQPLPPQPQTLRRESSISDMHGMTGGYSRSSGPAQSRLKESPYSATPPPQAPQPARPSAASPIDMQPADRDFYQPRPAQSQYMVQQQQSSAAGSPQLGPTYHTQAQPPPPQPSHRQYAFNSMQSQSHTASPQPQFAAQHQVHRSRHNSFDGRPPHMASTSAPPAQQPLQQGYSQAPPYPSYPPQHHSREDSRYANPFDRQRRLEDEAYHRRIQDEQRRMDERR